MDRFTAARVVASAPCSAADAALAVRRHLEGQGAGLAHDEYDRLEKACAALERLVELTGGGPLPPRAPRAAALLSPPPAEARTPAAETPVAKARDGGAASGKRRAAQVAAEPSADEEAPREGEPTPRPSKKKKAAKKA